MFVVSDIGVEMTNTDLVFTLTVLEIADPKLPAGMCALVAYAPATSQPGGPLRTLLVQGTRSRCETAMQAIRDAIRHRQHVLDLRDVDGVGQRPAVDVVEQRIILPGDGGPVA